jgi:ABC-type uncharacterized transport system permease subunit
MISSLLLGIAGAGYLAATMRYQRSLYGPTESGSDAWSRGRGFLWTAFVVHAAALIVWYFEVGRVPVRFLPETLAMMGWVMMALYLCFASWWNLEILGAFAAPLSTVLILASLSTNGYGGHDVTPVPGGWLLGMHVAGVVIGYAAFLLATIVAILYFFQTFLLKSKNVSGVLQKMPSLESLDRVTYRLIALGFPAMVIGIGLGFVRAQTLHESFSSPDVFLGVATCVVYALYIQARMFGGWHGRRVNTLLLIGFFFLVATYVGVGVLPWGVHQH